MSLRLLLAFASVATVSAAWDLAIFRVFYQTNADFLSAVLSGEDISRENQLRHYKKLKFLDQAHFGLNTLGCICCIEFLRQENSKYSILYATPIWFLGIWFGSTLAGVSSLRAADYQSLAISALLALSVVALFRIVRW